MASLECLGSGVYTLSPSPSAARVGVVCADESDASSGVYLIDSGGCAQDARIVLRSIEAALGKTRVLAVICTHSHSDHAGGAAELVRQTGCEVWTTAGERGGMENNLVQAAVTCGGEPVPEISVPYYVGEKCAITRIIGKGDFLTLGAGANAGKLACLDKASIQDENSKGAVRHLVIVPLPGHYFDMAGVVVKDGSGRRVFFVADALFGAKMVGKFPIPFMLDIGAFMETLNMIEHYRADLFVPSHGDILTSCTATVEMNRLTILTTIAAIEKALSKSPLTTDEVLEAVADAEGLKMRTQQYFLVGSTMRSFLAYLYKQRRIYCRMEGNKLLWETVHS